MRELISMTPPFCIKLWEHKIVNTKLLFKKIMHTVSSYSSQMSEKYKREFKIHCDASCADFTQLLQYFLVFNKESTVSTKY